METYWVIQVDMKLDQVLSQALARIAAKKKPYVEYITGSYTSQRMVKVTPDVLDPEELRVYKEIKGIKDEVTN